MPAAIRFRSGSSSSKVDSRWLIVVDSPPGMINASTASSSAGRRTGTARSAHDDTAATCSRTSPCSARTPITGDMPQE